jgi:Spy/CpxP family protein refolding chaperone
MVVAERAPWQNPRILTTLLLVFLAGASAGALSMKMGLHDKLHRTASAGSQGRDAVVQKFKAELELSGAQTDQIAAVLEDYKKYYQSLQDQLDDLRANGKSQILRILNPEQRVKFEKMMAELAPQLAPQPLPPANPAPGAK